MEQNEGKGNDTLEDGLADYCQTTIETGRINPTKVAKSNKLVRDRETNICTSFFSEDYCSVLACLFQRLCSKIVDGIAPYQY